MNSFIKSLMDENGLKQKKLAEILGISSSAVSQWNDEGTNIGLDCLFSLSKLFHVTVDEILEGKRTKESLEDKWKREYDINENGLNAALIDGEKEKVLKYLDALYKANDRFFVLFEKKITGEISENESKEWAFIRGFYNDVSTRISHLFNEVILFSDNIDDYVLNRLFEKYGRENKDTILWEIKKIYKIKDYDVEEYFSDFDDDLFHGKDLNWNDIYYDADIFYAWYKILTPIEKDDIINLELKEGESKIRRIDYLYELMKRGGNIRYSPKDLNLPNYDYSDLDELEGVKPVPELDKAKAVIYDNYFLATYEQYKSLINHPRMQQIEMAAKYKEKNPIKYWEYIKNNEVLI